MKIIFLYIMAAAYLAAGIYHFVNPDFYKKIMPAYLPYHMQLIFISGACEILFGLLLLPASTRIFCRLVCYYSITRCVSGKYSNGDKLLAEKKSLFMDCPLTIAPSISFNLVGLYLHKSYSG